MSYFCAIRCITTRIVCVAFALASLAGCLPRAPSIPDTTKAQTDNVSQGATPAPTRGGTFITFVSGDPTSLNGILTVDGNSLPIVGLSQNPLTLGGVYWGHDLEGDLAERWDVSPDGRTWTFYLRKGVKWQDGQPFTADDVLFTIRTIQDKKVLTPGYRERFVQGGEPIPWEKVDDYTVRAVLKQPIAGFASNITVPILPHHLLDGQDVNKTSFNRLPVGTGPFKVTEWRAGESVTLERNPDFYRGAPYLDKFIFRIVPNQDAAITALLSGESDFGAIRGKDVPRFKNNPNFTIITSDADLARMIVINHARPFFKDVRVRRALNMLIDRPAVIRAAEQGYAAPADSPFNQPVFIYRPGKLVLPTPDLSKAKALLAEAGWADTDGDGVVERDGQPLGLTLEYDSSWTFMAPVAELVQATWKQAGVEVKIHAFETASFTPQVFLNRTLDKPYDALLTGWGYMGSDPDRYAAWLAPSSAADGPGNYFNPQVKELFDRARVSVDQAERRQLYEQVERLLWDDVAIMPLYYPRRIFVYSQRVGLDQAVLDATRFPPFRYPEKLYMRSQ